MALSRRARNGKTRGRCPSQDDILSSHSKHPKPRFCYPKLFCQVIESKFFSSADCVSSGENRHSTSLNYIYDILMLLLMFVIAMLCHKPFVLNLGWKQTGVSLGTICYIYVTYTTMYTIIAIFCQNTNTKCVA